MLDSSTALAQVMQSNRRHILPRAVLDLVDPDIVYDRATTSGHIVYSILPQLHNKVMEPDIKYASVEIDRWALDGTWMVFADDAAKIEGESPYIGAKLSSTGGSYSSVLPWVSLNISGCRILQGISIVFTDIFEDGYGIDFKVEVFCGADIYYTENVTGNTLTHCKLRGFTVYDVTAIRVTFQKWSRNGRYPRLLEIVPGVYEDMRGDMIYSMDIVEETDFSCVRLAYDTAAIEIRNDDRMFDPRNKDGVFRSIEERQAMPLYLGVRVPGRRDEFLPRGVFYRQNSGWETARGGATMIFRMVSIIGLLANRKFIPPSTLPATLGEWVAALVAQLGHRFEDNYIIEGLSPSITLTCSRKDVENVTCGTLLRYICMAIGAYPRADTKTGFLRIAPPDYVQGVSLRLDNITNFPTIRANENVADLTFRLAGTDTQYLVGGVNNASMNTLSISNFFIKSPVEAGETARRILRHYGGQRFEALGFGDLRAELGDVSNLELGYGDTAGGRCIKQQFRLHEGVMFDVPSHFVAPDGETVYSDTIVLTQSGSWRAPPGVTVLRVVLVGGGSGGEMGEKGNVFTGAGKGGNGGHGGRILTQVIGINPQQLLYFSIGAGGAAGYEGGDTVFGNLSSRDGPAYDGWVDIVSGGVYGKSGSVGGRGTTYTLPPGDNGLDGTGNGGQGGFGGRAATILYNGVITESPGIGGPGGRGGNGCVIISYDL